MNLLKGLVDFLLEKRMDFLANLNYEFLRLTIESERKPLRIWKKLMNLETETEDYNELMNQFFENNSKKEFYQKIAEKINDPTNFEELKQAGIFTEQEIKENTLIGEIEKIHGYLDNYFLFSESLKTFPWYFERYGQQNCVGTTLILGTLLHMKKPEQKNKTSFIEIYSTKRIDTLEEALKNLEKGKNSNEPKIEFINDPLMTYYLGQQIEIEADTFHGVFPKEQLQEMIAYRILNLEQRLHGILKTEKNYLDHELEVKNIKQSNEYTLNQGTFLFSYLNLLTTLKNDPFVGFNIEEEFEKLYEKKEFRKSIMLNLLGAELGRKECKNYLIEQYDKNLPYHLQEKFGIKKREMPETIRTIMQENH